MNTSQPPLQALIFDVDGTLADNERDGHRVAFNLAFADAGLDWHWDDDLYRELLAVTGGKERMRFFCEKYDADFLRQPGADEKIKLLHAAKTAHYVRIVETGQLPLRPGVAQLIADARAAGLRLAIATTTSLQNVEVLLRASLAPDAMAWFEVIGAGDVVPAKKPAPDIYLWVLERLGLPAASCLALEDSANGLRSALGAGIPTLITEAEYTRGEAFTGALAVLPNLASTRLPQLREIHRQQQRN